MPVCGEDQMTYISPCHAGCKKEFMDPNGRKVSRDLLCTFRISVKFYYFIFSLIMIVPVYRLA